MKAFKKLSLGTKLILLCVALQTSTFLVGGVSFFGLNLMEEELNKVTKVSLPNIQSADNMYVYYNKIRIALRTLGLPDLSREEGKSVVAEVVALIESYEKENQIYKKTPFTEGEQKHYDLLEHVKKALSIKFYEREEVRKKMYSDRSPNEKLKSNTPKNISMRDRDQMKKITVAFLALSLNVQIAFAQNEKNDSLCALSTDDRKMDCAFSSTTVKGNRLTRQVDYSLPAGKAPRGGWPVVMLYQGSFFPVEFSRSRNMPFGGFNEVRLIKSLLDNGFAVVAPRAIARIAWLTNIIGVEYEGSEDFYFIQNVLGEMKAGTFGKLNMNKLFATGISSGGYHSSRMAVTFPGMFTALAVNSAAYANCGGPLCVIPDELPANHPPTIFLHGKRDRTVPVKTMQAYYEKLKAEGIETDQFVSEKASHQWLEEAPELITNWFLKYL